MAAMNHIRRCARAALFVLAGLAPAAARAERAVDLELVLAVDVSGSIDAVEARMQRDGYVAAIRHPDVIEAIQSGDVGAIAVAYVEWAGYDHKVLVLDWREVRDRATAEAFAAELERQPISTGRRTSISGAIDFSMPLFDRNAFDGARRTIDISGDGANNDGRPVLAARDAALAAGVTINGLPILNDRPNPFGFPVEKDLDLYYEGCVIGGPGAFIVVARDFHAFAAAIRRKLILEIAQAPPAPGPAMLPAAGRDEGFAPGCDVGERRLREYFGGTGLN
jgi:hypothetical protein